MKKIRIIFLLESLYILPGLYISISQFQKNDGLFNPFAFALTISIFFFIVIRTFVPLSISKHPNNTYLTIGYLFLLIVGVIGAFGLYHTLAKNYISGIILCLSSLVLWMVYSVAEILRSVYIAISKN